VATSGFDYDEIAKVFQDFEQNTVLHGTHDRDIDDMFYDMGY